MGELELEDLLIEWDDNKAEINVRKHKIHFEDAARIFLDENKPKYDDEIDYSDIPKMTKEELAKFKPARLRQQKSNKIAG